MAFNKRKYFSKLFGSDVWITNLPPRLSVKDKDISVTNLPVYSTDELGKLKGLPNEVLLGINLFKTIFRESEIKSHGECDWSKHFTIDGDGEFRDFMPGSGVPISGGD